jgi:hypothetical protein
MKYVAPASRWIAAPALPARNDVVLAALAVLAAIETGDPGWRDRYPDIL